MKFKILSIFIVFITAYISVIFVVNSQAPTPIVHNSPFTPKITQTENLDDINATQPRSEPVPQVAGATATAPVTTKPKPAPKPVVPVKAPKQTTPSCPNDFAGKFLCLLNQYRASQKLGPLKYNGAMSKVALDYSKEMLATGNFNHIDKNGGRFTDRCSAAGITCLGENLAKNFTGPENLLKLWQDSPPHNKLLLGDYTLAGLGASANYASLLFR